MDVKAKKEIEYLKEICGVSGLTIKGLKFIEQEEQSEGADFILTLYTNKFKPLDHRLKRVFESKSILSDIVSSLYKKIDSLKSKKAQTYHYLTKFSYGVIVKGDRVSKQITEQRYNNLPLYLIPTIVRFSFDLSGIDDDESLLSWKAKVKANGPFVEFIVADKPFIPQELFDYQMDGEWEGKGRGDFYLQLFDIDHADDVQSAILKLYKDDKDKRFPLLEKEDDYIKEYDYLESLELKEVNEDNLRTLFSTLKKHLEQAAKEKSETLCKSGYELDFIKILFALSEKEIDVLYKAYCLIDESIKEAAVEVKGELAASFFQSNETELQVDPDQIFLNSAHHYGSFNINLPDGENLISLALNQRVVLNSTAAEAFRDGDVLAVNGPPGTGKTTVLQSIIANMVAENTLSFIESPNSRGFVWNANAEFWTPKLLNVGCSFTQQAVKNILSSLNFDPPKYKNQIIDLIWNKRWIFCDDLQTELPYVLDSSRVNENRAMISYFFENADEIDNFFTQKYCSLFTENLDDLGNMESILQQAILDIKKNLESFKLGLFKNVFYFDVNVKKYGVKKKYLISDQDVDFLEKKIREAKDRKASMLAEIKEKSLLFKKNAFALEEQKKSKSAYESQLEAIEKKSYAKINNDKIDLITANQQAVLKQVKVLEANLQVVDGSLALNRGSLSNKNKKLENIKKSLLSKVKIFLLGSDGKIDSAEKEIEDLEKKRVDLDLEKRKADSDLEEKKSENEALGEEFVQCVEALRLQLVQSHKECLILIGKYQEESLRLTAEAKQQDALKKELEGLISNLNSEMAVVVEVRREVDVIFSAIKGQLENECFLEFYYAKDVRESLLKKIESKNVDLLELYESINLLLDNTLRYKCFQMSMRLKEWYFITLTKELSSLPQKEQTDAFVAKGRYFKNTKELYELNYFSLIFPLIISTLHSLGRKVSLYQDRRTVTLPGKIDNVIVDESGQISVEIGYIAAWNARRLLCVGDTDQIKPVFSVEKQLDYFISRKNKRFEAEVSLDDYGTPEDSLGQINCSESSLMTVAQKLTKYHQYKDLELSRGLYLVEHRRCPDEIINYCNEIIYKGVLVPKKGSFDEALKKETAAIARHITAPWKFVEVTGEVNANTNEAEAMAIFQYVQHFIDQSNGSYSWETVGKDLAILSPYRKQADFIYALIKNKTRGKFDFHYGANRLRVKKEEDSDQDLIIGTVHALQGAERKIILFSFVSNDLSPGSMVIKDKSILNVAFSRSKLGIVMFGSGKVYVNRAKEMATVRRYIGLHKNLRP